MTTSEGGETPIPVKGNSLLPPKLRVTKSELTSISTKHLYISSDRVSSSRPRFLDVSGRSSLAATPSLTRSLTRSFAHSLALHSPDGDLLNYCAALLTAAFVDNDYCPVCRRIYALGQAVCSMKHASLKLNVEMEAEYFFRAAEGLSMPTRLESLPAGEIAERETNFMDHLVLILLKNHYHVR